MTAAVRDPRYWLVFTLLAVFFAQGLFLIQDTSPTTDEVAFHMVTGYVNLMTRDFRLSPANPPLVREWMALPWLLIRPKLDLNKESWRQADCVDFETDFFYKDNRAIANRLLYSSRFMVLLLGTGLAALIFFWSKKLYGLWGGLLSLALFTWCPSFIAHSALATIDIGAAFFFTLSAFFFYRCLTQDKPADIYFLALTLGSAFAAKINLLFFGPVFLALLLWKKGFKYFFKAKLLIVIIGFAVIWASHLFEFKPLLAGGVPRVEEKLGFISAISRALFPGNPGAESFFKMAALHVPIPMPTYFLGIAGIFRHHTASTGLHYTFGQWTVQTHWYHYFVLFLAKMTIPFLILLLMRAVMAFRGVRTGNLALLTPVLAYFFVMCFEKTANGSRYLFPAICLLFVWVGGAAKFDRALFSKAWKLAVLVLLAFNLSSVVRAFPDHLAYFNALAGGSERGYRLVRDSDVDWGQGLKRLKKVMDHRQADHVTLLYFGTADPSFYGINSGPFSEADKKTPGHKVYAVSLQYLESVPWAATMKPTAVVGHSIFLYDLRS